MRALRLKSDSKRSPTEMVTTYMKKVRKIAGVGNDRMPGQGEQQIYWRRYFADPPDAALLSQDTAAWIPDLMIKYLKEAYLTHAGNPTPLPFVYASRLIYRPSGGWDQETHHTGDLPRDSICVFLVTMGEMTGMILRHLPREKTAQYALVMPFPAALSTRPEQRQILLELCEQLQRHHGDPASGCIEFKFAPTFKDSNLWTVYMLLMRLHLDMDIVQAVFLQDQAQLSLEINTLMTHSHLGKIISWSIDAAPDAEEMKRFFNRNSTIPIDLSGDRQDKVHYRAKLLYIFKNATMSTDEWNWIPSILPEKQTPLAEPSNTTWDTETDAKWDRFRPEDTVHRAPVYWFA